MTEAKFKAVRHTIWLAMLILAIVDIAFFLFNVVHFGHIGFPPVFGFFGLIYSIMRLSDSFTD